MRDAAKNITRVQSSSPRSACASRCVSVSVSVSVCVCVCVCVFYSVCGIYRLYAQSKCLCTKQTGGLFVSVSVGVGVGVGVGVLHAHTHTPRMHVVSIHAFVCAHACMPACAHDKFFSITWCGVECAVRVGTEFTVQNFGVESTIYYCAPVPLFFLCLFLFSISQALTAHPETQSR